MTEAHAAKPVVCPKCGMKIESKSQLARHLHQCGKHPAWPFAVEPATDAAAPKEKED